MSILLLFPIFMLCTTGALLMITPVNKERRNTMRLFGLMLIIKAITSFCYYSYYYPSFPVKDVFESIKGFFIPLIDPILFFCLLSFGFPLKKIIRRCWLFFLPPVILGIWYFATYVSYPVEVREIISSTHWHTAELKSIPDIFRIQVTIDIVTGTMSVFYLVLFVKVLLIDFSKFLQNTFSNQDRLNINWLVIAIFFFITFAILEALTLRFNNIYIITALVLTEVAFGIVCYYLLFKRYLPNGNLLQSYFSLFFYHSETKIFILNKLFPTPTVLKHQDHINDEQQNKETLHQQLEEYFKYKEPYLQKNLSLDDIAKELNTNRTYVSQLFSRNIKITFYDYVNGYRIEKSKKLLAEKPALSLKSLAEECGFNSYSTFVKYFERREKCSPTEWRNTYMNKKDI